MKHTDEKNSRKQQKQQGQCSGGKRSRKDKGKAGEKQACEYLLESGYMLLAVNYFSAKGELDIVALDAEVNELVGIEVKNWTRYDDSELQRVITPLKKKRMMYTMGSYLTQNSVTSFSYIRFDVILLHENSVHHYKDVFW